MIFANEEIRIEFHKANTMMQMLAQTFESMCFSYGVQVKVINVLDEHSALLEANLKPEFITDVLVRFNAMYGRIEADPSLHLLEQDDNLFIIHGDVGSNLKNLN